jgi:hypothetical protein
MKYLVSVILCLVILKPVSAAQTDDFINYLSKIIYKDCSSSDIIISAGSPFNPIYALTPDGLSVTSTNITMKWQYSQNNVKELISQVVRYEPYNSYAIINGQKVKSNAFETIFQSRKGEGTEGPILFTYTLDGEKLISCSNKFLTVNGINYIWNGKIIELPRYTIKILNFNFSFLEITLFSIPLIAFAFSLIIKFRIKIKFRLHQIKSYFIKL